MMTKSEILVLLNDLSFCGLSFGLAFAPKHSQYTLPPRQPHVKYGASYLIAIAGAIFLAMEVSQELRQYASTSLLATSAAVSFSKTLFIVVATVSRRLQATPPTACLVQCFLLLIVVGAPRVGWRMLKRRWSDPTSSTGNRSAVQLAGVGEGYSLLMRAIAADARDLYRVVGVLSMTQEARGRSINGAPILGDVDELQSVARWLAGCGESRQAHRSLPPLVAGTAVNTRDVVPYSCRLDFFSQPARRHAALLGIGGT